MSSWSPKSQIRIRVTTGLCLVVLGTVAAAAFIVSDRSSTAVIALVDTRFIYPSFGFVKAAAQREHARLPQTPAAMARARLRREDRPGTPSEGAVVHPGNR